MHSEGGIEKGGPFTMKILLGLVLFLFCTNLASAAGERSAKEQTKGIEVIGNPQTEHHLEGGTLGEYVSEKPEEQAASEEETENKVLAPIAKPVVTVIEGVETVVEPALERKEIKDKKGKTQAIVDPKAGKVKIPF